MYQRPPNFRLLGDTAGCGSCIHFYLTSGWKGAGECTKYGNHFTDEKHVCDDRTTSEKPEDNETRRRS